MERVLPIRIPPCETYQWIAFTMGMLMEHESVRDSIYNSYINLKCDRYGENQLNFIGGTAEDYRVEGIGEMDLFYLKNLAKEKLADFFKERIDQDNYLLLFHIDEYYLSYTDYFNKEHHKHDTYIYGYDDENFYVMAYHNLHLQKMKVPAEEIIEGLYGVLDMDPEAHFCSFRVFHKAEGKCDLKKIKEEIKNYFYGFYDEGSGSQGIEVYKTMKDIMSDFINGLTEEDKISPKLFRMFWEHKKMLVLRNTVLEDVKPELGKLRGDVEYLENTSSKMMLLALKYNKTHDKAIPARLMDYLGELYEIENNYFREFYRVITQSEEQ